jgi:hypothetical protein
MLVQDIELQLVRPPVSVGRAAAGDVSGKSARSFFIHDIYLLSLCELLNSAAMNNSVSLPI